MHFQKPAWIKEFRAWVSETLINKGLAGRAPGDALFARVSGHSFGDALNTRAGGAGLLDLPGFFDFLVEALDVVAADT